MAQREVNIKVKAEDQASKVFEDINGRLRDAHGKFVKMGDSAAGAGNTAQNAFSGFANILGNVATVAGGIVAANVFGRIADGIGSFVKTGLDAVGQAQQLEASLNALLTSNNMYTKVQETLTTVNKASADQMVENQERITNLQQTNNVLTARIQEQTERVRQMSEVWTDGGLNVQTARAELEKMQYQLGKNQAEISNLSGETVKYNTTTKSSYKKTMSQVDAFAMAQTQTRELTDYISKLAVISPFETQQVEAVAKYAVAAGLSVDETTAFAAGFLDLSAAVGIGSDSLGFAADQLLQVSKVGKLTEIDLRQLRRLGIDLGKVLEVEMGMGVDEFNKKAETTPGIFNDLFNAVTKFSKNTFAGTSQAMATSVKGLQSTISDIFVIGSREFFRPLVDAASPMMALVVGKMSDAVLGGSVKTMGENLAKALEGPLSKSKAIANAFGRSFGEGFRMIGYFVGKAWPDIQAGLNGLLTSVSNYLMSQWDSTVVPAITGWQQSLVDWIPGAYANIPNALNGLLAGINGFLAAQGPKISASMQEWSAQFWAWTKTALSGIGQTMGALLAALVTWAASPEASAQLMMMGQNISAGLYSALTLAMQNTDQLSQVMMQVTTGLTIAAAAIAASLAIVGGTILAGIFSGISERLTGYQPWTIKQFQEFGNWVASIDWGAVGSGLMYQIQEGIASTWETIRADFSKGVKAWGDIFSKYKWGDVGGAIISGIMKGIKNKQAEFLEYIKKVAGDAIAGVLNVFGISSPSKVFADIGTNLIAGLIKGTTQTAPQFVNSLTKTLGVVTSAGEDFQQKFDKSFNLKSLLTGTYMMQGGQAQNLTNMVRKMIPGILPQVEAGTFGGKQFTDLLLKTADQMTPGAAARILAEGTDVIEKGWTRFMDAFKNTAGSFQAGNISKITGGISQIAQTASSSFNELQQRIATVQSLIRRGIGTMEIEGQVMNAAQAQKYLNGLIAQQVGMQENLSKIQANQKASDAMQGYVSALNMIKSVPSNAGTVIEQSARAIELLSQQVTPQIAGGVGNNMTALLKLLAGNKSGGNTTNNINLVVNSNASESSVLNDFVLLQSLIPTGT